MLAARGGIAHLRRQSRRVLQSTRAMAEQKQVVQKDGKMPARTWQQTMLRIKDPNKSLPFYRDILGFTHIDTLDFDNFTLYFLESLPKSVQYTLTPGTEDAHRYNFSTNGVVIELTHNKGDEHKDEATVYPGNGPKEDDAFGHLAISTEDVYEASRMLEEDYKVTFKKRPNEGKMSGIAFFSDPDGYSIEIVEREKGYQDMPTFGIAQTMIRTKRLNDTINFFQNHFNMTLVRKAGIPGDFVNAFMATVPQSLKDEMPQDIEDRESAKAFVAKLYSNLIPVLELTHNEGVDQLDFEYHSGNENEPDGTLRKGFGHVGFLVPDVYETCKELKDAGCSFQKEPEGGSMKGLAFAKSPDGIWCEVVKRGGHASGLPYE